MKAAMRFSVLILGIVLFANSCRNDDRDQLDYTTPGGQIFNSLVQMGILDNTPHSISVNVTGYNANNALGTFIPLILRLNGANDLSITQDGSFPFTTQLVPGQAYNVSVFQQPDVSMKCTVSNATGAIYTSDVNIDVLCEKEVHSISGSIFGLNGDGLTLDLIVGGVALQTLNILKNDTAFSFIDVPKGTVYTVAVGVQPTNLPQTCTVTNASGTVLTFDISGVIVNCTTFSANISGTINNTSGLLINAGTINVKLERKLPADALWSSVCNTNFPGSALADTASAAFDFGTSCKILAGYEYQVTVVNSPAICSSANNTGTIGVPAPADITNVQINCVASQEPISGTINGLTGSNLRIRALVNGSYYNYSSILSAGATSFTLPSVPSGSSLDVSISTQPNGAPANIWQNCTVTANANIASVPAGGVNNIAVSCTTNTYNLNVNVTGGTVDTLDSLTFSLDGAAGVSKTTSQLPYTFTTALSSGTTHNLNITVVDPDLNCTAGPYSFTVAGNNPTVNVTCSSKWKEVSVGNYHTLAIRNDGTLWGWGRNAYYELTSGISTAGSNTPKKIGTADNWVQVSAGFYHSAARNSLNELYVWGYNNYGQVGDNSTTTRQTMFKINAGGVTAFSDVSAGPWNTMAISTTGVLYGWGHNAISGLCNGNSTDQKIPVAVSVPGTGGAISYSFFTDVDAGLYHTLLRRTYTISGTTYTNSLWGCGYNGWGQLGLGNTNFSYPSGVKISDSNWWSISAGNAHSLAILKDPVLQSGSLYGMGYNEFGQLGLGNYTATISDLTRISSSNLWASIDTGYDHSTAVLSSYNYGYLWGYNADGQLGNGNTTNANDIWGTVNGITSYLNTGVVAKTSAGRYNTAYIKTDGTMWMTGYNYFGTLGNGNNTNQTSWQKVY